MTFTRVARELRIDRDTARLLSQATYHQLVLALRELIANSHDGNAAHISLTIELKKPGEGTIIVLDDGDGMSQEEFEGEFLLVGQTWKSPKASGEIRKNRFGRPLLGQFGIGFISAVPFAKEVLVETKRREDEVVSGVKIDCEAILKGTGPGGENSFKFPGWNRSPTGNDADKFTRIELVGLTHRAYESIDASIKGGWYETRQRRKIRIDNERREDYLVNWVSRIAPLGYREAPPNKELGEIIAKLLPTDYIPADVSINGRQLVRVIIDAQSLQDFELRGVGNGWHAKGVLWSPNQTVQPVFARGIAVRVGDMSVGEPGYLGLNAVGRVFGKLQHITGEVQVSGLESAMQLDRQGFYATPESDEFNEAIRKEISGFEGKLQKKATVMEKFRVLKKQVDASSSRTQPEPGVAPILSTAKRVLELSKEADEAGIRVERIAGDSLTVPKGEKGLTVGADYGAELLNVQLGKRVIRFNVVERGNPMSTKELVACLFSSDDNNVTLRGPHVLISADDVAIANLRLLAVLRQSVTSNLIRKKQVELLLEELSKTYR